MFTNLILYSLVIASLIKELLIPFIIVVSIQAIIYRTTKFSIYRMLIKSLFN